MSPTGSWAEAYAKAAQSVSQLTLLEKFNLTTGTGYINGRCFGETGAIPRLGFHGICL
jgi:beta-glucosidase